MAIKTYTETTCQGCGKVDNREGVWDGVPPVGWLSGDFQIAGEPSVDGSYVAKQEVTVDALCVVCGDAVLKAIGVKRQRRRRVQEVVDPVKVDLKTLDDVDRWAHKMGAEHTYEQPVVPPYVLGLHQATIVTSGSSGGTPGTGTGGAELEQRGLKPLAETGESPIADTHERPDVLFKPSDRWEKLPLESHSKVKVTVGGADTHGEVVGIAYGAGGPRPPKPRRGRPRRAHAIVGSEGKALPVLVPMNPNTALDLEQMGAPIVVTIACPHGIEQAHSHEEQGDTVTCITPPEGWADQTFYTFSSRAELLEVFERKAKETPEGGWEAKETSK